jgi:hypothetical protein
MLRFVDALNRRILHENDIAGEQHMGNYATLATDSIKLKYRWLTLKHW